MSLAFKKNERYTYKDYSNWNDDERWELINGVPYNMSPAPSRRHQEISRNLLIKFGVFLQGKKCKVYDAPFDVRLPFENQDEGSIENVVQPDIVIVCDKNKLDDRGCIGAPDIVIEIISPYTSKKDLNEKFNLYERAGVTEYWIVYPLDKEIIVYKLVDGKYDNGTRYSDKQVITIDNFDGLEIILPSIFEE